MNKSWRTPTLILICGGLILTLSLGTRQGFGLFLQPMTSEFGWGRATFAFAIALQNLVWGVAQPFSGMIADRFGAGRVLAGGAALYALGLALMALSSTGVELALSAGVLLGLALSGTSFGVVYGVIGRTFAPEKRSMALGIASAAGSFGQFAMIPYGYALISNFGWYVSLFMLAASAALMAPLARALATPREHHVMQSGQSMPLALAEALKHKGFWLLSWGFLVCGFQTLFISVHLPAFLLDREMSAHTGMMALALIGLFNVFGSFLCSYLGGHYPGKYLLSVIYLLRALLIAVFITLPMSPWTVYVFAAAMGFLWLGTVPLTNGVVAQIFGVRYLSTLFGIVFLFHQIGSFLGIWFGGYLYDLTGSYQLIWIIAIALGVIAALLNWPIDDRQIARLELKESTA
ncbi:MAG: MFS transporter [Burkholderiales bacterium]|nr:MFS transporter [Burkholderiales bacterium]